MTYWYALSLFGWTLFGFCMGVLFEKCSSFGKGE